MFRFTKKSRFRHQLAETIAYIHKRIRIDRDILTPREIVLLHTSADEAAMGAQDKEPAELASLQAELAVSARAVRWRRPNLNDVFLWVNQTRMSQRRAA